VAELLESLLRRCRCGQTDAVETLVARFREHGRQLAAAILNDEHEAEDALQEAFLTALGRLGDLRSPAAFPAWFRRIVRTKAVRMARRRHAVAAAEPAAMAADESSPAEQLERKELRAVVRKAVTALPPAAREATEMFYLEQLRQHEIAEALGVPEGTVKRRLHDARIRLRDLLLGYAEAPPESTHKPMRRDSIDPDLF